MPFPGTAIQSLTDAWTHARQTATDMKNRADLMRNSTAVTRMQVLIYGNSLADALASLTRDMGVPGLSAYAQAQQDNPALNVATEFATMRTQIVASQDWVVANFPKDASGNAAVYSFDANKRYAEINLGPAQLTAFKNQLALLSATID